MNLKREPAFYTGLAVSVLTAVTTGLNDGLSLKEAILSALPFAASLLIRPQVTPNDKVLEARYDK